jgi:xanthine dehydrogenase accessory factor
MKPIAADVLVIAEEWHRAGRDVAIATVVETWGSAPRRAGSHLVVDRGGNFEGSVSGGCVEAAVIGEALEVITHGQPKLIEFGVTDETAWGVGLSCGGRIRIYVEKVEQPVKAQLLAQLNEARRQRRSALVVTELETGAERLVFEDDLSAEPYADEIRGRFGSGVSGPLADARAFVTVSAPQPRFVIVGAVHIAQALVPMANMAGFETTVVDPRQAFATHERFPEATLFADWPERVLPNINLDSFTALAALSHNPRIDDPALIAGLRAQCFYIGALGSSRSHAKRIERLRTAGIGDSDLARVHGPIGLPIGAQSPAEIAVSILAEAIAALRRVSTLAAKGPSPHE